MTSGRGRFGNPALWLIVGIPLLTLIGGYLTLRLAYQTGESDEVPDDVTRTGQAQVVELAPDQEAMRLRLVMSIAIDPLTRTVSALQVSGRPLPAQAIELQFVHPLKTAEDRAVQLQPSGSGWVATLPKLADSDWRLVLKDSALRWRLTGRMPRHASLAAMRPSLPP